MFSLLTFFFPATVHVQYYSMSLRRAARRSDIYMIYGAPTSPAPARHCTVTALQPARSLCRTLCWTPQLALEEAPESSASAPLARILSHGCTQLQGRSGVARHLAQPRPATGPGAWSGGLCGEVCAHTAVGVGRGQTRPRGPCPAHGASPLPHVGRVLSLAGRGLCRLETPGQLCRHQGVRPGGACRCVQGRCSSLWFGALAVSSGHEPSLRSHCVARVTVPRPGCPGCRQIWPEASSAGETSASQAPSEGQSPATSFHWASLLPGPAALPLSPGDVHTDPLHSPVPRCSPAQPPAPRVPTGGHCLCWHFRPLDPNQAQGQCRPTSGPRQDGTLCLPWLLCPSPEAEEGAPGSPTLQARTLGWPVTATQPNGPPQGHEPAVLPPHREARGTASPALGTGAARPPGRDTVAAGPGPPPLAPGTGRGSREGGGGSAGQRDEAPPPPAGTRP